MTAVAARSRAVPQTPLPPISLDLLNEEAAFQSRVDAKYFVGACFAERFPKMLPAYSRQLSIGGQHRFSYHSIYFDTPDLLTYRMSAHRRRRRFKVRTRAYLDSGAAYLEVKTRGARGVTDKTRIPHDPERLDQLSDVDLEFITTVLRESGLDPSPATNLSPYLVTEYERATYLTPATTTSMAVRTTVDSALYWEQLREGDAPRAMLFRPGFSVIEAKSGSVSNRVNQFLWRAGVRPGHFSKYCVGAAALDPRLPANKWHRPLQELLKDAS